ncbi:hypothetical protein QTP70_027936 [Hemibagrus guttatus]|uniref:ribonuclease H n=1 Tax=Hemibagrus guttatus TaxID=175788 RepID=A0AAE0RM16_9TELE|nr:hypothetical protein QTP70_027936 [Hemibagrus guttatus]
MKPAMENRAKADLLSVEDEDLVQILSHVVQEVKDSVGRDINGTHLLHGLLNTSLLQSLLKVYECLQQYLRNSATPYLSYASGLTLEILSDLRALPYPSYEARELYCLLMEPHMQALLSAHDVVGLKDYEPVLPPLPEDLANNEEAMRIVCMVKNNQPLGATIRRDEMTGEIYVARVIHGGLADRSGLLHAGDRLVEVNGHPVFGLEPEQIIKILVHSHGTVMFKVVPITDIPVNNKTTLSVRAMVDYNPHQDPSIPCVDAGMAFMKGNLLEIVDQTDALWWQAKKLPCSSTCAGLIPSACILKRKLKEFWWSQPHTCNKILSTVDEEDDMMAIDVSIVETAGFRRSLRVCRRRRAQGGVSGLILSPCCSSSLTSPYEEVVWYQRHPEDTHRLIALLGPSGVGVNELRRKLIEINPRTFLGPTPHTTRPRKMYEEPRREYHFLSRDQFENMVHNNRFVEYGEFRGHLYGTSVDAVKDVLAAGKICIIDIDPYTIASVRTPELKAYIIYIKPPPLAQMKRTRINAQVTNYCTSRSFKDEDFHEIEEVGCRMEQYYGLRRKKKRPPANFTRAENEMPVPKKRKKKKVKQEESTDVIELPKGDGAIEMGGLASPRLSASQQRLPPEPPENPPQRKKKKKKAEAVDQDGDHANLVLNSDMADQNSDEETTRKSKKKKKTKPKVTETELNNDMDIEDDDIITGTQAPIPQHALFSAPQGQSQPVAKVFIERGRCELEEKERFWSELDEVMESIPTGERVVIGADFNGHVGEGNTGDEEVMGKFGVKERNLEGQMVVDFAKRMDMGVVNTYFQKREEHRVTYKSGGRRTQVDYILCRRGNLKEISDCKVVVGESVARQHRMVVCRMTLMVCKTKRSKIEKKTKWWKLKKEECCEEFRQKLRQALGGQVVLPDDWETTAEVIRETGRKVLGVSSGRRKEDKETWWWNEEVQDSIQRKRLAKKKWDMDRTEENRQEYKELQRRVKREVSKAKQKAYDELYTRLDTREGEKDLYRLARQRDRDGKDVQQVRVIKDRDGRVLTSEESVQRRWKEYFEELMNEENEREKRVEGVNSVEQKVDKIRKDEVRKALKRMKSGKAVGPDDIPVEVWKCLGEAAVEFLANLFNRVLESERMPEEWRRSVLVPIFKNKGDVQSCSNYRGIKLMSHTMKVWERVVEARLRKVVDICEQQYGFMPRKSTTDAIFALRILMEKYRDGQKELHCVFVDLEKAYDRVPREELWYCMRKSGVAEKYVRVVQDMYERSRTVVRCAVGQTEEFNVEVGLHQGSALSPFLFAIVMDQLSEEVRQESPWTMMFADDIVICSESREQVEENLERWRFALERRGMKVSGSKTEYMCVNEREGSGTVRLQGEEVKKVQEFKYLGSTVQSNGECGKEVKKRVQAGWNGWRKVSGVLCDQKISARIKGKVYRTVVSPAMLYGLETVSLRKRQESELEVAELKMLRFSLGVTRLDRIRNEYIRGTAHVGRLGDKVREARLRWFGHVQRRESRFQPTDRTDRHRTSTQIEQNFMDVQSTWTTRDISVRVHRGFRVIGLFSHGFLAGFAVWNIIVLYVLAGDQMSALPNLLQQYYTLAYPAQCLFYLLLTPLHCFSLRQSESCQSTSSHQEFPHSRSCGTRLLLLPGSERSVLYPWIIVHLVVTLLVGLAWILVSTSPDLDYTEESLMAMKIEHPKVEEKGSVTA